MEFFNLFILSQVFAGIAFIFDFLSFQQKTKKRIMIMLAISASFLLIHYLLLNQSLAVLLFLLSIIRYIFCIFTSNKKIMFVFLILNCVTFYFVYEKVLDLMIFLGVSIGIISNFQKKDKALRLIAMCGTFLIMLFNILIFSPVGAIVEANLLLSNIIGYYRYYIKKDKKKK